jgi:hypothetical protein
MDGNKVAAGNERGQGTGRAVTHARGLYFLSSTATLDFGLELYDIYIWFYGSRLRFSDFETTFKYKTGHL